MNYEEIKQLRAYARYDGIYLAIVWAASFTCFLASPLLGILATFSSILTLSTPFFVAYRLKVYREIGLNGTISFKRAYFYCIRVFTNAALLFSLAQWLYMNFLDHGKVASMVASITSLPEYDSFFAALGISREEYSDTARSVLSHADGDKQPDVRNILWRNHQSYRVSPYGTQ